MSQPVTETFLHRPWSAAVPPKKILAMRFHAFGDVVITLPYLQALKNSLPGAELHLLTREECADIPRHALMFSNVFAIDDRRSPALLAAQAIALLPRLVLERYDAVLDLQRNALSRMIRRSLVPKSFAEFDRFSLRSAGERVRSTIDALGLPPADGALPEIAMQPERHANSAWTSAGYADNERYVILNPAGSADTKNWPIGCYDRFARLWNEAMGGDRFLIVGTGRIASKADFLKRRLGARAVDLVNATTAAEALMLVRQSKFVLSEDSGLMHMAWISRVPLVALFGSTPAVWSAPPGDMSVCLNSSDLECGGCGSPQCRYGDVRCLTRYTPEFVLETAQRLLDHVGSNARRN